MKPWNKSLNFIFPTKYVIPKSFPSLAIGQVSYFFGPFTKQRSLAPVAPTKTRKKHVPLFVLALGKGAALRPGLHSIFCLRCFFIAGCLGGKLRPVNPTGQNIYNIFNTLYLFIYIMYQSNWIKVRLNIWKHHLEWDQVGSREVRILFSMICFFWNDGTICITNLYGE